MKRSTVYLIVAFALLCVGLSAFAKGSSQPQSSDPTSSVVDATKYPRALVWNELRLWQTIDGVILVCPEIVNTDVSYDKDCYNSRTLKKGESKQKGWIPLQDLKIEGMVLKAYEYRFIGSSGWKMLVTYFGPPEEQTKEPTKEPAVLQIKGPVQVTADKVIVQRRKK